MTDTTWINQPQWHSLKRVDADFVERFQSEPAIQPKPCYDDVRFQILRFAGRQAAAAVRIACSRSETELASVAEQAMLYEPFTYWDWHGYDELGRSFENSDEQKSKDVEGARRKRRLLWERERAFRVNGEWEEYPNPRKRFEGFKSALVRKPENKKFVKRFAVASWMTEGDFNWIARNLPQLEALDLSDVPRNNHKEVNTWLDSLRLLSTTRPYRLETFPGHFTYLDDPRERLLEENAFLDFVHQAENYSYNFPRSTEKRCPHSWYIKHDVERTQEKYDNFEEFFWRLCEMQQEVEESDSSDVSIELEQMKEKIAESHLWRRLKWLGLPDWRTDNKAAKVVLSCIPKWAVSLKTVSIRGEYTRDRSSTEIPSVHHHVCQLIIGIEKFFPASVTTLELRLSVSFLRYLLEQLEKRKPSIERVGIDLGAWVQVFPLRSEHDRLEDADIRAVTRQVAHIEPACGLFLHGSRSEGSYRQSRVHYNRIKEFVQEQEYADQQPSFFRDRSGDSNLWVPVSITEDPSVEEYGDTQSNEDDSFDDLVNTSVDNCPIDSSEQHTHTIEELDKTRTNTLPTLLEKLHLARPMTDNPTSLENSSFRMNSEGKPVPQIQIQRRGAQFFALEGEKEQRCYDPIHPLTLTQAESLAGVTTGQDYDAWSPDMLHTVYSWVENTFAWRPVFDWDWFMNPVNMRFTADPALVNMAEVDDWRIHTGSTRGPGKRGKVLQEALGKIKKHFGMLNEANIPVHLLIGRRDPDVSSCYWGWPYTAEFWESWIGRKFTANLEGIAEHVNVLSIFYDLRNPLDTDRLWFIEARRPRYPPEGKCPIRVCPFKGAHGETCPFVRKYPALRNFHPRPQVKGIRRPPKFLNKPGINFPKPVYGDLADSDTHAPPTGEHADDHSKDDDSETEGNDQWPLQLTRRSVYARESVGWQRFWHAYATSFTRLTTFRVRMPQSMDKVGSWRLARLLNRQNGWLLLDYTDERQHLQTEEDLFPDFENQADSTPASVYTHKKQSRSWPAGRFVRRSWVWDPLLLTDTTHTVLTKMHEDSHPEIDGEDVEEVPIGKKYTAYKFEPRTKLDLSYPDANINAGESETFQAAIRDVKNAIAAEIEILDPPDEYGETNTVPYDTRILQPDRLADVVVAGHGGQFKSAYGHHVRNVAGAQWREELREMIAYAEGQLKKVKERGRDGEEQLEETLQMDCELLNGLLRNDPPYERIFEIRGGQIALRDVDDGWDFGPFDSDSESDDDNEGGAAGVGLEEGRGEENNDAKDQDDSALPLTGNEGRAPAAFGSDSDADSLFGDSGVEAQAVQPEQPLLPSHSSLPERQASLPKSSDRQPSGEKPENKKPARTGPFDTGSESSSPEKRGNEPGPPGISIVTKPLQNPRFPGPGGYEEGAIRSPVTPIDENYSDEDASDGDKNLTGAGNEITSAKKTESGNDAGGQVEPGKDTTEHGAAAENVGEEEDEGMSFMEWLTQTSRANQMRAATLPVPTVGGAQGIKSGNVSAQEKDAAGKGTTSKETFSATPQPESNTPAAPANPQSPPSGQKRKNYPSVSKPEVPSKKSKTSAAQSGDASAKKASPSKPSPDQPSASQPALPTDQKRKDSEGAPSAPAVKKVKTLSGRETTSYTQPPDESDGDDDDDQEEQRKRANKKRTHSKADYIPSPTEALAGEDTDEEGDEEVGAAKKRKEKKAKASSAGAASGTASATVVAAPPPAAPATGSATAPATAPSAPLAAPAAPTGLSIQVPPKADGSGDPDYRRITVKNLRTLAKERGVSLRGATLKDQIIRKFEDFDDANGGAGAGDVVS